MPPDFRVLKSGGGFHPLKRRKRKKSWTYRGNAINNTVLRLDLLVEDTIVIELKSIDEILPIHKKQLLSYLRLTDKPLGLLINFNVLLLKEGIVRVINTPPPETQPIS